MAHYILYARVSPKGSSWDGTETTVPDQLRDGRNYVLARDPAATFTELWDEFATANHARMPSFQRILADLRTGNPPWQAVVFRHIDRIGRSAVEVIQFGAQLAACGRYFIAYAMPFPTEPPVGPLVLGIFALLAEFERSMLSQRIRHKMRSIASAGGIPYGKAPYGYRRAGPHDNRLVPDPVTAPNVTAIFRRYADGDGVAALSRTYGLSRQSIWNILRRRTYLGVIAYGGHEYPGAHQPLTSEELFQRAARLIPGRPPAARARRVGSPLVYPLSGLVRCTCGRWLTAASARGRGGTAYRYYQCTDRDHCRRRVVAADVEDQVFAALRDLPVRTEVIDEALRLFLERLAAGTDGNAAVELRQLESNRAELDRRRSALLDSFAAGLVTRDNAADINRRLSEARDRIEEIDRRLSLLRALASPDPSLIADATAWARTFRELGKAIAGARDHAPGTLQALLRAVVERVDLVEDGDPLRWRVVLRLAGSPKCKEWQPDLDSNQD